MPIFPILLALAGLAYLTTASSSKPAPVKPPPPAPPKPLDMSQGLSAGTMKILTTKQALGANEALPFYASAPMGGDGVFSTKRGGPRRTARQGNPLFPYKFAPDVGQTPRAFAKEFTGDEARFTELIGMPGFRSTSIKTYPSGIVESLYQQIGVLSPTLDGKSWILLKTGESKTAPWSQAAAEKDQIAILLPPSWRAEITEGFHARVEQPSQFVVDEGAEPKFTA